MADFTGVTNPKRVIQRRMDEAEEGSPKPPARAASAPPADPGPLPMPTFERPRTKAERENKKGLAEALRKRGY